MFDAAAEMISRGGFPTPESRQSLIVTLAGMPEDEPSLRKEVGRMRLRVAQARDAFHPVHGTDQPSPMAQPGPAMPPGAPNAGV